MRPGRLPQNDPKEQLAREKLRAGLTPGVPRVRPNLPPKKDGWQQSRGRGWSP